MRCHGLDEQEEENFIVLPFSMEVDEHSMFKHKTLRKSVSLKIEVTILSTKFYSKL